MAATSPDGTNLPSVDGRMLTSKSRVSQSLPPRRHSSDDPRRARSQAPDERASFHERGRPRDRSQDSPREDVEAKAKQLHESMKTYLRGVINSSGFVDNTHGSRGSHSVPPRRHSSDDPRRARSQAPDERASFHERGRPRDRSQASPREDVEAKAKQLHESMKTYLRGVINSSGFVENKHRFRGSHSIPPQRLERYASHRANIETPGTSTPSHERGRSQNVSQGSYLANPEATPKELDECTKNFIRGDVNSPGFDDDKHEIRGVHSVPPKRSNRYIPSRANIGPPGAGVSSDEKDIHRSEPLNRPKFPKRDVRLSQKNLPNDVWGWRCPADRAVSILRSESRDHSGYLEAYRGRKPRLFHVKCDKCGHWSDKDSEVGKNIVDIEFDSKEPQVRQAHNDMRQELFYWSFMPLKYEGWKTTTPGPRRRGR